MDGGGKNYEVCYDDYVKFHPWGEVPQEDKPLTLPVSRLCHVTHRDHALEIIFHGQARGKLRFMPNRKMGKSLVDVDIEKGFHRGESYRSLLSPNEIPDEDRPCYVPIPNTEDVLLGYYSWWGLSVAEKPISWAQQSHSKLPNYLQDPPDSIYGSKAFSIGFHDILESYASARGSSMERIYFKVGGTMRYKREIAYIVIVCTNTDDADLFLQKPITQAPTELFDMQGLVNSKGKVVDKTRSRFPLFTTRYYDSENSHETLNFAFYFQKQQEFMCSSNAVLMEPIRHTGCIRKRTLKSYYHNDSGRFKYQELCPDSITDVDWQKHYAAIRFASRYGGVERANLTNPF